MGATIEVLPDLSEDYALTAEQVRDFLRDGHVLLRGLASAAEVALFRPVILEVLRSVVEERDSQGRIDDYSALFTQVTNAWRKSEAVRRFAFARRFAKAAAELMGVAGVRLYHDQALIKRPGGQATPWHQDQYYWPLNTEDTITMWMPLVDVTTDMGPMIFASTSHRSGYRADRPISDATAAAVARLVSERGLPLTSAELRAGDASFHSGLTLHSSHANRSATAREVMTVIYFAEGTRLKEPENEHQRVDMEVFVPGLGPGDPAASPLNPLLYRR